MHLCALPFLLRCGNHFSWQDQYARLATLSKTSTLLALDAFSLCMLCKVRSFYEDSCATLIFITTSGDIKRESADVVLKTTTILKEMRVAQLSYKMNTDFRVWNKGIATNYVDIASFIHEYMPIQRLFFRTSWISNVTFEWFPSFMNWLKDLWLQMDGIAMKC